MRYLSEAAFDIGRTGHLHARRILRREHFKVLYERNPDDVKINPFTSLVPQFGAEYFRHDRYHQSGGSPDFPVRLRDGQVVSSLAVSETLNHVPVVFVDYVFAERSILTKAHEWLRTHRADVVKPKGEANNG